MPLSSSRLYCGIEWRNLLRHHFVYQTCLVYINVVLTTYLIEVLYAYGIFHLLLSFHDACYDSVEVFV